MLRKARPVVFGLLVLIALASVVVADPPPDLPGMIAPLRGHTDAVYAVGFTPNGKQIVTGSFDKSVRVWDAATGKSIKTLAGPAGHQNLVLAVTVSPDGRFIASGGSDNSLRMWELPGGPPQRHLSLGAAATDVAISADGTRLAVAGNDGAVRLINNADGKTIATLKGSTGAVQFVAFSPDNQQVVALGADRVVRSWNAANGQPIAALGVGSKPATSLALAPNSPTVYSAGQDGQVKAWRLPPMTRPFTGPSDVTLNLVPSPDGNQVLSAGMDRVIRFSNPANGQVARSLEAMAAPITALAAAGDVVAAGTQDQQFACWLGGNNKPVWTIKAHGGPIAGAAVLAEKKLAVSAGRDGYVKVWRIDADTSKPLPAVADLLGETHRTLRQRLTVDEPGIIRIWPSAERKDKPLASFVPGFKPREMALSHDGQRLALLGQDHVHLLDTTSGQELYALPVKPEIRQVCFVPDSHRVVTIAAEDRATGLQPELERAWLAHPGGVVAATTIGNELLTIGADRTIKSWDASNGRLVRQIGPLPDPLYALASDRAGALIAVGSGRRVLIWNLADLREVARLDTPTEVAALAFGSDQKQLLTAGTDQAIRWWDLEGRREIQSILVNAPIKALANLQSIGVLVAGADKTLTAISPPLQRVVPVAKGPVQALAVTPDGSRLLAWNEEKGITVWNPANGEAQRSFEPMPGPITALACSRNAVLVAAASAKEIRLFTLADGKQVGSIPITTGIQRLTFSPNSQVLAACGSDQTVQTWNVTWTAGQPTPPEFGQPLQRLAHQVTVSGVVFAPDNVTLHTVAGDGNLRTWKPAALTPTRTVGHPNLVDAVAVHPDGTQLATGAHDGIIRIYDVAKGQSIREIKAHVTPAAAPIYSLSWSPDGKQLLSSSLDRSLKLWDAGTGNLVREFKGFKEKEAEKGHRDGVFCAVFSPDGKLIASGSSDRTIKLWNVADASVVRELTNPTLKPEGPANAGNLAPAHPGWVYGLRFSPDGKQLVSAGAAPRYHGYLAVWNVADGKLLSGEQLAIGPIHGLALAPDGKSLVLGCGVRGRQTGEGDAYLLRLPRPAERK